MMRLTAILASAALVAAAPLPAQEVAAPGPVRAATIAGRVLDVNTGAGVAGAVVYLPALKRGALTDATGGFAMEGVPEGEHRWRIQRLGYATWEDDAEVGDGDWFNIRLLPRPEVLSGITVVADGFEARRRRATVSVHVAERPDIVRAAAGNGAEVLESVAGVDVARCTGMSLSSSATTRPSRNSLSGLQRSMGGTSGQPALINPLTGRAYVEEQNAANTVSGRPIQAPSADEECLMVNGQMLYPQVFLDDEPVTISHLLALSPDEMFLLEVYGRGEAVYVYTQRGVERMARDRDRPRPIARF